MLKRLAVAGLPIAMVVVVALPLVLDQPFGAQTPRLLSVVYTLRRWSPAIAAIGAAAWLARQNSFEWTFNPLPQAYHPSTDVARHIF